MFSESNWRSQCADIDVYKRQELNGEGWKVVSMTQSTAYQVMFLLIKE